MKPGMICSLPSLAMPLTVEFGIAALAAQRVETIGFFRYYCCM
jgi:hypothetical protein